MRAACVILQPSVGNKDVILERKPSNKDRNKMPGGPPPVIHKQVGFLNEYEGSYISTVEKAFKLATHERTRCGDVKRTQAPSRVHVLALCRRKVSPIIAVMSTSLKKTSGLKEIRTHDLCDTVAVLYGAIHAVNS